MEPISQILGQTLQNMTFLREVTCEGCGEKVQVYEVLIPVGPYKGQTVETKKGCRCKEIEILKEIEENRQQAIVRNKKRLFDAHSLINKKLQQATLENYEPRNHTQERAKRIAERFVEIFDIDRPMNLLFTGSYGIGKSHLAKGIADKVMEKKHSAIFISVPKLLTKFRASYNKDAEYSEEEVINALNTVDVLIMDDLGAEKSSEWAWEKLFEIVDQRQGMHTIYTTNLTASELASKLGERNFSRVANEDTTIIEMQGDNYRMQKFGL